jgi:hypothetical protein
VTPFVQEGILSAAAAAHSSTITTAPTWLTGTAGGSSLTASFRNAHRRRLVFKKKTSTMIMKLIMVE